MINLHRILFFGWGNGGIKRLNDYQGHIAGKWKSQYSNLTQSGSHISAIMSTKKKTGPDIKKLLQKRGNRNPQDHGEERSQDM